MPRVILINPFIKHYAGSVFDISDTMNISGWDEEEHTREKLNFSDKLAFHLPDAGNGKPTALPVTYVLICPSDIYYGLDLTLGPCRITSVSPELEDSSMDRISSTISPFGIGKVRLDEISDPSKNLVKVLIEERIQLIEVFTYPDTVLLPFISVDQYKNTIDFSNIPNGFYRIVLYCTNDCVHEFTMIKCFPLVLTYQPETQSFKSQPAIW